MGGAFEVIAPDIGQAHLRLAHVGVAGDAAAQPRHAAYLEQIGEIGGETDIDLDGALLGIEIAHRHPFIHRAAPQEPRPPQMDEVMFDRQPPILAEKVGIGEIAGQHRIIIAHRRTEQDRTQPVHSQIQMREVPGIAMIQALRAARPRNGVAAMVEHGEAFVMFERPGPPFRQRSRRRDEELRLSLREHLPRIEIGHGGIGLAQRHACSLRLPAGPVLHPASCRGAAPSGLR